MAAVAVLAVSGVVKAEQVGSALLPGRAAWRGDGGWSLAKCSPRLRQAAAPLRFTAAAASSSASSASSSSSSSSPSSVPVIVKKVEATKRDQRAEHDAEHNKNKQSSSQATVASKHQRHHHEGDEDKEFQLACPICHKPLDTPNKRQACACARLRCSACRRTFDLRDGYYDLTVTANLKVYREDSKTSVELFRNPLVSFVYERGWRQNFAWAGFPGVDEEFKTASDYFAPVKGGVLVDMSCGSGLFTRRFAASGDYKQVIAADFSESMLTQTKEYLEQDVRTDKSMPTLVRADVARLPFETESIDAVHAGAALHCWPSPAAAVMEISRVLKPGGIFVASTFMNPRVPIVDEFIGPLRKAMQQRTRGNGTYRWFEEEELGELTYACGLVDFLCEKNVHHAAGPEATQRLGREVRESEREGHLL
eukprot:jgi/Chlat1/2809/Chrsp187S08766